MKPQVKLYPFQQKGLSHLINGFETNKTQCLAWYTGSGKTNVIAALCAHYIKENPKIKIGISAYLMNQIKDQITDRLILFGLEDKVHKIISGLPIPLDKNIYVFIPQSIHKKEIDIVFDLFIVDESHAGLGEEAEMLPKIIKTLCTKKTKILLVSATPWDTLALKEFKDIPVLKRPLDLGFEDNLIADFKIHAEEALITFTEDDFTRQGDLGKTALLRSMAILKSTCIGKLKHILKTYGKEIGKKCVVICPTGNFTEVPLELAKLFNGLPYVMDRILDDSSEHKLNVDMERNLTLFKKDPNVRFLFVAMKCQTGFDMPELDSIIDLTMTRNIQSLVQRIGRVARKSGKREKHYFYVYDRSLLRDRLEWVLSTIIDFSLGNYDGWTTKTSKHRSISKGMWLRRHPLSISVKEIIKSLTEDGAIENRHTISFVDYKQPRKNRTLDQATEEAKAYSSRTEMWSQNPGLYKWFRLHAKSNMDKIFPFKKVLRYTLGDALKIAKKYTNRKELKDKKPGVSSFLLIEGRKNGVDYMQEIFGETPYGKQSITKSHVMVALSTKRSWSHVLEMKSVRHWINRNGGEEVWLKKYTEIKNSKAKRNMAHYRYMPRKSKKDREL